MNITTFRRRFRRPEREGRGYKAHENLINTAIAILKADQALPMDLVQHLLDVGVDVQELENIYG